MTSDVAVLCSLIRCGEGNNPEMLLYVKEGLFVAVGWVRGGLQLHAPREVKFSVYLRIS